MGIVGMLVSLIYVYNEVWGTGSVIVMANYLGRKEYEKARLALKETTYGKFFGALIMVTAVPSLSWTATCSAGCKTTDYGSRQSVCVAFLAGIPFSMAGYSSYTSLELPGKQFGPCGLCYYRLHSTLPWTFSYFGFLDLSKTWSGRCWLAYLISWVVSDMAAFVFITTPKYELPTTCFKDIKFTEVGGRYSALVLCWA